MAADRPVAILHAPADVGGNAYGLSRAERELGLDSDVAVFSPGPSATGTTSTSARASNALSGFGSPGGLDS